MAGYTSHYGFQRLGAGDAFSENSYKFTDADRVLMDRLVYLGAEGHRHTGESASGTYASPSLGASISLTSGGGALPSGTRVYYKYAYVDAYGNESAPSPEVYVDTPTPIDSPNPPSLTYSSTGGTLLPGTYFYVLAAYRNTSTEETLALSPAYITVLPTTSTNTITLTLPSPPTGAHGFNVYRQKAGGDGYYFVKSIATNVATPPTTYVDTGADAEDCNRTLPISNSTFSTNTVTISLPGATPIVPTGYTWKIYRTFTAGNYTDSVLASGISSTSYADTGLGTTTGQPAASAQFIGSPDRINLEDGSEIQGRMPPGHVAGFPYVITFAYNGYLSALTGITPWLCEFPSATIMGVRASLGSGYAPASQPVIVDVNKGASSATPTYSTIFTTQANRPQIPVGAQVGDRTQPNVASLVAGDSLTVDIDQAGGGATPTDRNLIVNVYMWISFDTTSSTNPPWT